MATANGSFEEASSPVSRSETSALHAGYIKRVDMSQFPTVAQGKKTVILSPEGEKVTVLHVQEGEQDPPVVLLAIQAALGVPLSRLNFRGANVEHSLSLVDKAAIRISFMNEGPNAFEPFRFGRRVLVERSFFPSGPPEGRNVVRMADQNGTVVATGETSLSRMLQYFKVTLNNVVDDELAKTVLMAHPKSLYFIFRKMHNLEASSMHMETEEEVLLRSSRSLLEQELIKKKQGALKLKQEMEQMQNKSREWSDFTNEMRLQYHLACYRKFREECTRTEELYVQWQWRRTKAKENLDMRKEPCANLRQQAKDRRFTELKDKLVSSATQKHVAKCCLEQVQNEIAAARKELSRLKLALLYAKREGCKKHTDTTNIIKAGAATAATKLEPGRNTSMVAVDNVATSSSSTVKQSCLEETIWPPSQRFLSEQEIVASAKEMGQQFLPRDLVTDITKARLHLARIEREEKELTERISMHQYEIANLMGESETAYARETNPLEQDLGAIDNTMTGLQASIAKLQVQCRESLHAAKANSIRAGYKTHGGNRDLLVLVDQGVAKEDPEVYKAKLKQAAEMAARYTSMKQGIEEIGRKLERLSSRERAIECDQILKRAQLERQGHAVNCSFRNLIRLQHVEGNLVVRHESNEIHLMGSHPVASKYWVISFLFALLDTSRQSLCMWLGSDDTVVDYDQGYYLNVLIANAIELKQNCQSIFVTNQPLPTSNPYPLDLHTVDLTNYVDLTSG